MAIYSPHGPDSSRHNFVVVDLSFLASGQELSAPQIGRSGTSTPKLPIVDDKACPGNDQTVPNIELTHDYKIYSSWQDNRREIGGLKAGESVTVLDGVNVVREPDKAVIKYVGPDEKSLSLKVGDVAFGYGIEADANDVFRRREVGLPNGTKRWRKRAIAVSHRALVSEAAA